MTNSADSWRDECANAFQCILPKGRTPSSVATLVCMLLSAATLQAAPAARGARLLTLAPADVAVICLYFAIVLGVGLYLKRQVRASDDFFFAGKGVGTWVAGLSFVAANLGTLELLGWSASAYQYGMLAAHWYWIGAVPAMLFLGIVMIPFYYVSKAHSVPGYLKLRYGEGSASALRDIFRRHDHSDERHQHVLDGRGDEGHPRMGHQVQHPGLHRDRRGLRRSRRAALRHRQ